MAKRWYRIPIGTLCFNSKDKREVVGMKESTTCWRVDSVMGASAAKYPAPNSLWVESTAKIKIEPRHSTGFDYPGGTSLDPLSTAKQLVEEGKIKVHTGAKTILADIIENPYLRKNTKMNDPVNYPKHYTSYPGIEVIQLTRHMNFCKGNAVKYIARAEFKGTEIQDLEKAVWYLQDEITRLKEATND